MIKKLLYLACLLVVSVSLQADNPDQIWKQLQSGNKKFVQNDQYTKERKKVKDGQNPNYVILSCADSRVPPELVFSQGVGDLFVCRVAGQVADNVVVDSIEYAIAHFDLDAIVVLGHTGCGAVIGALNHLIKNNGAIDEVGQGHLNAVLIPIEIAILEAGINIYAPNAIDLAIEANISYIANQLMVQSPVITEAVNSGNLCIIGAQYDLQTGKAQRLFSIQ